MAKQIKTKNGRVPFRQLFTQLLEKEMSPQRLESFGGDAITDYVDGEKITPGHVMAVVMMHKAMKGDAKAFEFIRDTIGEKPKDKGEQRNVNDVPKIVVKRKGI